MRFAANYDRNAVVLYAHQWAYGRNPAFYDYEHLGGDCTNFASQCVFAGSGVMNFTPTFGWYYICLLYTSRGASPMGSPPPPSPHPASQRHQSHW